MIFEFTKEEQEQLAAINERYNTAIKGKYEELRKPHKDKDFLARLLEETDALENTRIDEMAAVKDAAEQARVDAFNGDIAAIAAEARRQVPLIIEAYIEYGTKIHGVFRKMDKNVRITTEPGIPSPEARNLIDFNLRLHKEALKGHEEELTALNRFISEYISTSPYIYINTEAPSDPAELVTRTIRNPLAKINTYGMMNDKVNHHLIGGDIFTQATNGQYVLAIKTNQAAKGREQVIVSTALTFEGVETNLTKRMTAFDSAVYNALSTCYYYNSRDNRGSNLYITPQEIWRIMNGTQDANKNPSPTQLKRVSASIDKMRFTRLYMDITEEIKGKYISDIEDERIKGGSIDASLLHADKVTFTTEKGRIIEGYEIMKEPILYTYNAAKNHILFCPLEMLDISDTTGNEGNTTEIKNYLLQQIILMQNTKRSRRILFDTMYSSIGLETPEQRTDKESYVNDNTYKTKIKQEAKKDRDKAAAILESWKAKKFIKGFKLVKKGSSFIGVEIELTPQKQPE